MFVTVKSPLTSTGTDHPPVSWFICSKNQLADVRNWILCALLIKCTEYRVTLPLMEMLKCSRFSRRFYTSDERKRLQMSVKLCCSTTALSIAHLLNVIASFDNLVPCKCSSARSMSVAMFLVMLTKPLPWSFVLRPYTKCCACWPCKRQSLCSYESDPHFTCSMHCSMSFCV